MHNLNSLCTFPVSLETKFLWSISLREIFKSFAINFDTLFTRYWLANDVGNEKAINSVFFSRSTMLVQHS